MGHSTSEYNRKWKADHAQHVREYGLLYLRKWRVKNKDRNRMYSTKYMREWRAKNPDRVLIGVRKWQKKNIDKVRSINRKACALYKARKLKVTIEPIDYNRIIEKANGICGICKQKIIGAYHFDHIYPISLGGMHTEENIQLAHPSCNVRKSNRIIGKEDQWQTITPLIQA